MGKQFDRVGLKVEMCMEGGGGECREILYSWYLTCKRQGQLSVIALTASALPNPSFNSDT